MKHYTLAENMRRFKTKNLKEDVDQNNNGYPDESEINIDQSNDDTAVNTTQSPVINKPHDPRGNEVKVGMYLIHKSMPENRENILRNGLVAKIGERYQMDNGAGTKNRYPAIFATNSENEKDWFGEDWDEDVWRINSSLIPNVKWYKDKMFSFTRSGFPFPFLYKHVVTLDNIPPNALELIYKGTGRLKIPER